MSGEKRTRSNSPALLSLFGLSVESEDAVRRAAREASEKARRAQAIARHRRAVRSATARVQRMKSSWDSATPLLAEEEARLEALASELSTIEVSEDERAARREADRAAELLRAAEQSLAPARFRNKALQTCKRLAERTKACDHGFFSEGARGLIASAHSLSDEIATYGGGKEAERMLRNSMNSLCSEVERLERACREQQASVDLLNLLRQEPGVSESAISALESDLAAALSSDPYNARAAVAVLEREAVALVSKAVAARAKEGDATRRTRTEACEQALTQLREAENALQTMGNQSLLARELRHAHTLVAEGREYAVAGDLPRANETIEALEAAVQDMPRVAASARATRAAEFERRDSRAAAVLQELDRLDTALGRLEGEGGAANASVAARIGGHIDELRLRTVSLRIQTSSTDTQLEQLETHLLELRGETVHTLATAAWVQTLLRCHREGLVEWNAASLAALREGQIDVELQGKTLRGDTLECRIDGAGELPELEKTDLGHGESCDAYLAIVAAAQARGTFQGTTDDEFGDELDLERGRAYAAQVHAQSEAATAVHDRSASSPSSGR